MTSWTIPVDQTTVPQTVVERVTGESYGSSYSDDNQFPGLTFGDSLTSFRSSITENNGNSVTIVAITSSYTAFGSILDEPEGDFVEVAYQSTWYTSGETNGRIYTGTDLENLSLYGETMSRVGSSISGTEQATTSIVGNVTYTTTNTHQLWSAVTSGNETSFESYTDTVTTKSASLGSKTGFTTRPATVTFTEYGASIGDITRWPTYASATVVSLAPNEIVWVASTTSDQLGPISNVASSATGVITVYPSFLTFVKNQSHIYDSTANSGFATPIISPYNTTVTQETGIEQVAITVATNLMQIPFGTTVGNFGKRQTGSASYANESRTIPQGATKGTQVSIGGYIVTRVLQNMGPATVNVPQTIAFTAPVGGTGGSSASGETDYADEVVEEFASTSASSFQESTGNNAYPLGFSIFSADAVHRREQAHHQAAAAFNEGVGLNLEAEGITIAGPKVVVGLLEQTAWVPRPSTFTASIDGQVGSVSIGENITVRLPDETTTRSYNLEVVGTANTTTSFAARGGLQGANAPVAYTMYAGPGLYETHDADGASGTVSYSTQTSFTLTGEGATNYRASFQAIAAPGATQRWMVQSFATTTTGTFF